MPSYGRLFGNMVPVLFSIGNINASSFGVFLALGFLFGVFLIWRLSRAWDLDEEKVLDLTLLTSIGGLFGARLYFVIERLNLFSSPLQFILISQVPGFSFWGGFLGGWLILYFFARRFQLNFWQTADIAVVGFLGGLIFSDLGCLLGGCNAGIPLAAFFAIPQQGLLGKRWPVQAVEAAFLSLALIKLWSQATHFHQRGQIVSLGFIYIGVISLILEPLKQDHSSLFFSVVLIVLGLTTFYKISRQNPITHLQGLGKFLSQFATSAEVRKQTILIIAKTWYNQKTNLIWKLKNFKKLLRRLNVKFS